MRFLALSAMAALCPLAEAQTDVISIPAARDNTLFNDLSGGTSNGSGGDMIVGRAGGMASAPIRRGAIAFDVASYVPAGATIVSAQLVVVCTGGNIVARTIELHPLLASWGEGASVATTGQGAPSEVGDATWVHRFYPSTNWATLGGDFAATSASTIVDQSGTFTFGPSAAMTADVQAWLNTPSSSNGWLLKDSNETTPQTTHVFATRENAVGSAQPRLVITFTPPQSTYAYCPAKTNGLGCTPAIGWSGDPSASGATPFAVTLANALSQRPGMLVYSTLGNAPTPLYGGTLCVHQPLKRTSYLFSAGNAALDCSGAYAYDFGARILSGVDPALVAGTRVWCQWLSRDPLDATSVNLSNALRFEIQP